MRSRAATPARASGGPRPVAGLVSGVAAAASALVAGASLVAAGVVWTPPRDDPQAVARGARLYAAECAGCHGARLEGQAAPTRSDMWIPPLGVAGHAWRHPDAQLAAIVAHGTAGVAPPGDTPGMPAFAERLSPSDIDDVLAYVKSHWTAGARAYQAALNSGGGEAQAALLRNPAWTFPSQCLAPPAATEAP